MRVRKAVIPAAGLGTRFLPATKAQPKEMLPIVDTPIIQYVVQEAAASGIEDILIITGRGKRAIEDHFDKSFELESVLKRSNRDDLLEAVQDISNMVNVHFIRQKEALGLGHAVYQARWHVGDEPFAVLLGDEIFDSEDPCLAQLIRVHEELGGNVVAVSPVPQEETGRYGIVSLDGEIDGAYKVTSLVEKPDPRSAPSNLAVIGRYILEPQVFDILLSLGPGVGGEFQLTDALNVLAERSRVFAVVPKGKRYDVGDKLGFLKATVEFALKREDLAPDFRVYLEGLLKGGARPADHQ
ncbi:MAG: UTP--glucose-1-phosphate uridylyltransferase GalU [Firmicutes bacterium]|nr:UTP--glucose-1-phosphate uridylyltransferase GalU [Bacillota bacterium]